LARSEKRPLGLDWAKTEGAAAAAEARKMRRESLFFIEEFLQNLAVPASKVSCEATCVSNTQ
jgi:hypothetical protein